MKDNFGNTYAKASEIKAGMTVWLDSEFTCRRAGKAKIMSTANGLCFQCNQGSHMLDGQRSSGYLIGIYAKPPKNLPKRRTFPLEK